MNSNTPSWSSGDSPERPVPPRPATKFAWPIPGIDPEAPRLSWDQFLYLISQQALKDYPGPVGAFLAARLGNLMAEAIHLNAQSPRRTNT